jgi:hypothetical protein
VGQVDVDTRYVALDMEYGHEKCGSGQGGLDTSNMALDRVVWTRVMWLWTDGSGQDRHC